MLIRYKQGLKFEAEVRDHKVAIDQPKNAGGTDEGPTPSELLIASLGSCIGVYIVEYCRTVGLPHEGLTIELSWEGAEEPKRISEIDVKINMPVELPESRKKALIRVAEHCTVHNTLTHTPEIRINLS